MSSLGDFESNFDPDEYVGVNYGNYNNQTELQVLFAGDDSEQQSVNPNICTTGMTDPTNHCRVTKGGAPCYTGLVPVNLTGWKDTPTTENFTPASSQKYYSVWSCAEPSERLCPQGYQQGVKYISNPKGWKFGCVRMPPPAMSVDDKCFCGMSVNNYSPIYECDSSDAKYVVNPLDAKVHYGTIYYASNDANDGWQQCTNKDGCGYSTSWVKADDDQIAWSPGICQAPGDSQCT